VKDTPVPLAMASDMSVSPAFSSQRLINVYPERARFGGKAPFMLRGVEGLKPYGNIGNGPWRGEVMMAGTLYAVLGTQLWSIPRNTPPENLGTVPGNGYVSMATAGTQIGIATEGYGSFGYDSTGPTFAQITDMDFFGGTSVTALDGYFIWSSGGANPTRFQISALLDVFAYDALDFASAESTSTELIRAYLVGSEVFMMKSDRIEIWYDSGNSDFPFARMSSTIIPKGLAAKYSPAQLDNTMFWVGRDDEAGGTPIVYRANGYVPEVVSTPAVARALAEISDVDLTGLRGVSYIKDNHAFYGILLPRGNAWFYDISEQTWHERSTYAQDRWLGNGFMSAYGKTFVGSHADNTIYELSEGTLMDDDDIPLVAEFTLPAFAGGPALKRCSRLWLDMESGVGISTGQGEDPLIVLNVSDDGGEIYSSDLIANIGKIGQHGYGVEWRMLGQFQTRIHRFRISDPVKRNIIACWGDFH
jgi:hypothetical protein